MPDTGFLIAGTGGQIQLPGDDVAWTSPGNITADDATRATAALASAGDRTFNLYASNFGFVLPAGSTIVGVEVRLQRHVDAGTIIDSAIRLVNINGVIAGANRGVGAVWLTGVDSVATFGGPTDIWTLNITEADVENAAWGWIVRAELSSGSGTCSVDVMEMKIHYESGRRVMFRGI